ncbi:helix-turn-helix domain-containing protein [Kordia antarctica]|nr:helix-turn-helix domain-containing protein [Kordia antarctica]
MALQLFSAFLVAQNTITIHSVDSTKLQTETIKIDSVNLTTFEEKLQIAKQSKDTLEIALQKAKQSKDTLGIANAYDEYSEFYLKPLNKLSLAYSDSILFITKNLKNNEKFPALGYHLKGRYYYRKGKYNTAFKYYVDALHLAKENTLLYETINFNIALIKNTTKRHEEAKKVFKQYVNFLEGSKNKKLVEKYNLGLYALSHSLTYTGQLDSATQYIAKGMKSSIDIEDHHAYNYFVLNSGINSYFKKEYETSIDSLTKAKKLFLNDTTERPSLAFAHLYLGKNNLTMNNPKLARKHFRSVDSILEITKDVLPEFLDAYKYLRKHYELVKDEEKHLHYLKQEIKFNDIYTASYEDLILNLKDYDNEILIKIKDKIIKELNKKNKTSDTTIIILLSLLLTFAGAIYYFFRKQVIHKKRFHKLLAAQQEKQSKKAAAIKEEVTIIENNLKELPEDLVNDILAKLEKFEATDKFVKKRYTLPQLARELNTNGTYLSKVINEIKQVNFANYLNQLRIEYSIERITTDSRFREYTIKAIAEDSGFKTQQSFSAAFYKKTGIKPSFFIRQLKSKIKNSNN